MASSLLFQIVLKNYNNKVKQIEKDLDSVKEQLNRIYIVKIDSLEALKKSGKEDGDKLNDEILLFTGKRLLVAPKNFKFVF